MPPGYLSIVVAVTFHQVWPTPMSGPVVGAVALAALLNEVGAGIAVLRAMRRVPVNPERGR